MGRVTYTVTPRGAERLDVEARVEPTCVASAMSMREDYGPARDFAAGVSNVRVDGADAPATVAPGKLLVAGAAPFTLAYECVLPPYSDAASLLRGFRRGEALFASGMALFHRLHDEPTDYEVHVAGALACAAAGAPPGSQLHGFRCCGARELERAYFGFGDIVVHATARTRFVHERGFPFPTDDLLAQWPALAEEIDRIFGDGLSADWTVFLFASPEHPPGRPGVGFSLRNGALVSMSSGDDVLTSSHTLWLLLHERAHQWLGEAIGRADIADDWFFEGFASFVACEALTRAGLLTGPSRERLHAISERAIRRARRSGEPEPAHHGFRCARRWHALLARRGRRLDDVLTSLVQSRRGETLGGRALLAALGEASPDGELPDFVLRTAAASSP